METQLEETNQLLGKISQHQADAEKLREQSAQLKTLKDTLPVLEQEEKRQPSRITESCIREQVQKQKKLLELIHKLQEIIKQLKQTEQDKQQQDQICREGESKRQEAREWLKRARAEQEAVKDAGQQLEICRNHLEQLQKQSEETETSPGSVEHGKKQLETIQGNYQEAAKSGIGFEKNISSWSRYFWMPRRDFWQRNWKKERHVRSVVPSIILTWLRMRGGFLKNGN